MFEEALQTARDLDASGQIQGRFHGLPVSFKGSLTSISTRKRLMVRYLQHPRKRQQPRMFHVRECFQGLISDHEATPGNRLPMRKKKQLYVLIWLLVSI